MKTALKWFDIFLTLLFVFPLIAAVAIFVLALNHYNFSSSSIGGEEVKITGLFLVPFFLSLIYTVLGAILWVINRKRKNAVNVSFAKRMFFKGLLKAILSFAFYYIFTLALSFFGLSLESSHFPVVGDPNSPDTGFPIKDLKIIHRKQDADDPTECDITVLNTNPAYSAANIAVSVDGNENVGASFQDHIAPGKTDVLTVGAIGGGIDTQNPCAAYIIIDDAGIAKQ